MFRWPQGETHSTHTQTQSLPVPTFVKLYPKHETNPDFKLYSKDKIPKLTLNLAVEEVSTGLKCHENHVTSTCYLFISSEIQITMETRGSH